MSSKSGTRIWSTLLVSEENIFLKNYFLINIHSLNPDPDLQFLIPQSFLPPTMRIIYKKNSPIFSSHPKAGKLLLQTIIFFLKCISLPQVYKKFISLSLSALMLETFFLCCFCAIWNWCGKPVAPKKPSYRNSKFIPTNAEKFVHPHLAHPTNVWLLSISGANILVGPSMNLSHARNPRDKISIFY